MRRLFPLALLLPSLASAVPLTLNHQGRLMDALGTPLDGATNVAFSLYATPSGGTAFWTDSLSVPFDNGYFGVTLGEGAALDLADFDGSDLYMAIAVDGGAELPTRIKLSSVPYAFRAGIADEVVAGSTVNATEIQVNGTTVIDSSGQISASALPPISDTLLDIGCSDGEIALYQSGSWGCTANAHVHDAGEVATGTLDIARMPMGTTSSTAAYGDHSHTAADVGALPTGTTAADIGALPTGTTAADIGALADTGGTLGGNLSVNGSVQVGDDTATCDSTTAGTMRWANDQLDVCTGTAWTRVGGLADNDGSAATEAGDSCKQIKDDGLDTGDALYWVDTDGKGAGYPAYEVWCDMTLDGGGWQLAAWGTNGSPIGWGGNKSFTAYSAGTDTITPSVQGMADYLDDLPATWAGQSLNVRQTYKRSTDGTLNIAGSTTRAYTTASTFTGVEQTGVPPNANRTQENTDHNCTGYVYVNEAGSQQVITKGCFIEYTSGDVGNWAGCGSGADNTTSGVAWNLCFDNGDTGGSKGNSALGIWHNGTVGYHEIYEYNYPSGGNANGQGWGSDGGTWTWSAWLRPD